MNAAYRHWEKIGFYPTYYCCFDHVVGKSHRSDIIDMVKRADNLGIQAFMLEDELINSDINLKKSQKVFSLSTILKGSQELHDRITTGSHAVLWAASLGYRDITLLGIDQNYQEYVHGLSSRGDSILEVTEHVDSPNYYFSDYQRVGDKLHRPNPTPNVHAAAWRRVMNFIQSQYDPIIIKNASPYSNIPGTISIGSNIDGQISNTSCNVINLDLSNETSVSTALNIILPVRFTQIEDQNNQVKPSLGSGWQKLLAINASNNGRWHLSVNGANEAPSPSHLGSTLILHETDVTWPNNETPELHLKYDQIIHIWRRHSNRNIPIATLALKLDSVDEANIQLRLNSVSLLSALKNSSLRIFWRIIRCFDGLRTNRS